MKEDYKLVNNKDKQQYEFHIEPYICKIDYVIKNGDVVYLTHTEVPYAIGGQGIGTELVKKTLEDIDKNDMHVVPLCPFVATYMNKNPKWKKLLTEGISIGR